MVSDQLEISIIADSALQAKFTSSPIAHLFSGRVLNSNTLGIARPGGVCDVEDGVSPTIEQNGDPGAIDVVEVALRPNRTGTFVSNNRGGGGGRIEWLCSRC